MQPAKQGEGWMSFQKQVFWLILVITAPTTANAQYRFSGFNSCNRCQPIAVQPAYPAPVVPQVQTTWRQEQVTTYRPVTQTRVRREAVSVNVPVTTHKRVTVDEGGYKMVWVPKMVNKTVAETKYQRQVQYRDVPYQVVMQVPQVQTRLVPQQTVMYRPQTVALAKPCCRSNVLSSLPVPMASAPTPVAIPQSANLALAPAPTPAKAAPSTTIPKQATAPVDDGIWKKVPQRTAKATPDIELQSYQLQTLTTIPSAKGMFSRPTSTRTALRTGRIY